MFNIQQFNLVGTINNVFEKINVHLSFWRDLKAKLHYLEGLK